MTEPKPNPDVASRLPQDDRPGRRGLGPGGRRRARRSTPARTTRSRWPSSAAAAAAPARRPTRWRPRAARSSSSPWPTSSRTSSTSSYDSSRRTASDKVDVADDRKFIGFDAYQKAMDCLKPGDVVILATPPAFRWVHFTYAIEKGLQRLHGEARHRRRPDHPKMLALGEEAKAEEPEGRRRPDVPPLRGARGAAQPDQGRPDRRHRHCCAPTARPARSARRSTEPKPDDISELHLPDPQFHGFLWASGGCYSDFLIHNIDECCWMKDAWPVKAAGIGGRALPRRLHRPELRHLLGRVHLRRRHQAASWRAGTSPAATRSSPATPTARRARRSSRRTAHTPAKCRIYKGQKFDPRRPRLGVPAARAEPLPARVGPPDRRHPQGQALQRGQARRRGQPRHLDGPHGRAHRPGHHLRRHAQLPARVRARRRQADHGQPRAAADRLLARALPLPAAGDPQGPRVLI